MSDVAAEADETDRLTDYWRLRYEAAQRRSEADRAEAMRLLEGRRSIVTGASCGIGAEIARVTDRAGPQSRTTSIPRLRAVLDGRVITLATPPTTRSARSSPAASTAAQRPSSGSPTPATCVVARCGGSTGWSWSSRRCGPRWTRWPLRCRHGWQGWPLTTGMPATGRAPATGGCRKRRRPGPAGDDRWCGRVCAAGRRPEDVEDLDDVWAAISARVSRADLQAARAVVAELAPDEDSDARRVQKPGRVR
jgi:hypothetical protein